jgi:chaperonin GroES
MTLQPLGRNVIIEPDSSQNEINGILMPETSEKRPETGLVLAAGPDAVGLTEGDKVVYRKYGPDEVTVDGRKVFVLSIEDVIAVIR